MEDLIWGEGRLSMRLAAAEVGTGLVVIISGGESPHVGSVAVAVPRPSLRDAALTSATASVITVVGHKDDELSKPIAEFLAARLHRIVVVVAGVHLARATAADIECIRDGAWELARELCHRLSGSGGD